MQRTSADWDTMPEQPVAVLVTRSGEIVSVMPIQAVALELWIARQAPVSTAEGDASRPPILDHRRFRLSVTLRAPAHRWWRVYNGGRSRTPEDGYVYVEVV